MKNPIVLLTILVIIVIVGGLAYSLSSQKDHQPTTAPANENAKMERIVPSTNNSSTRYVEYSKAALDQASGNRRVLFFYADWCPTCRPADADFQSNSDKIPEDITVIRVNYNDPQTDDEEKALARQYGVTYQHTYVQIDSEGKEVAKWNGGQLEELLANSK